jgi:hypothetical protein
MRVHANDVREGRKMIAGAGLVSPQEAVIQEESSLLCSQVRDVLEIVRSSSCTEQALQCALKWCEQAALLSEAYAMADLAALSAVQAQLLRGLNDISIMEAWYAEALTDTDSTLHLEVNFRAVQNTFRKSIGHRLDELLNEALAPQRIIVYTAYAQCQLVVEAAWGGDRLAVVEQQVVDIDIAFEESLERLRSTATPGSASCLRVEFLARYIKLVQTFIKVVPTLQEAIPTSDARMEDVMLLIRLEMAWCEFFRQTARPQWADIVESSTTDFPAKLGDAVEVGPWCKDEWVHNIGIIKTIVVAIIWPACHLHGSLQLVSCSARPPSGWSRSDNMSG